MDEPHVAGHHVSVRRVRALVERRGLDPRAVADRLGLDPADVYRALAYYHDNPETMRGVRRRHAAVGEELAESSLEPPGVQQ